MRFEVERVDPNALVFGVGTESVLGQAAPPRKGRSVFRGWNALTPTRWIVIAHVMADSQRKEYLGRLHHEVPPWVVDGALFHIRIRVSKEQPIWLTDRELEPHILQAMRRYHELGRWWCRLVLLMPDHLHALLSFPPDGSMAQTVRDWKRGTARFQRVQWQENFFDHRIRNDQEADETGWYIRRNPVVKGLCQSEEDWAGWWGPDGAARQGAAPPI